MVFKRQPAASLHFGFWLVCEGRSPIPKMAPKIREDTSNGLNEVLFCYPLTEEWILYYQDKTDQSYFSTVNPAVRNSTTRWPSGLRRYVKAVVFTGVGSNPTRVNFCYSSFTVS